MTHHTLILAALRAADRPMTAQEIADMLGWPDHVPVNRRLPELVEKGRVERTRNRHLNRSGRPAYVYRVLR